MVRSLRVNPELPQVSTPEGQEIVRFVREEFQHLTKRLNSPSETRYEVSYVVPTRPRTGLVVYADGTEWDPGSGEGLYVYNSAGSWVAL